MSTIPAQRPDAAVWTGSPSTIRNRPIRFVASLAFVAAIGSIYGFRSGFMAFVTLAVLWGLCWLFDRASRLTISESRTTLRRGYCRAKRPRSATLTSATCKSRSLSLVAFSGSAPLPFRAAHKATRKSRFRASRIRRRWRR